MDNNVKKKHTALIIALIVGIVLLIGGGAVFAAGYNICRSDGWFDKNFEKQTYTAKSSSKNISIDLSSDDVVVRSADVKSITVNYYENLSDEKYKFEEKGDTLFIDAVRNFDGGVYFFFNIYHNKPFEILVPSDSTGSRGNISISCSSGDMTLSDLGVSELTLGSTSGDISLTNIQADGKLSIDVTSGDIDLNNVRSKETLSVSSTSGDINGSGISGNDVRADVTSGDIELSGVSTGSDITLDGTSSDISLTAAGRINDYSVLTDTSSGDSNITSYDDPSAQKRISVKTSSGDIDIDFENQ